MASAFHLFLALRSVIYRVFRLLLGFFSETSFLVPVCDKESLTLSAAVVLPLRPKILLYFDADGFGS